MYIFLKSIKIGVKVIPILMALFLSFTLSSCNPFSVDPLANYIIDEGAHESHYYTYFNKRKETNKKIAPVLLSGKQLDFTFRFKDSHEYDYTVPDGGDINKLYGLTSVNIHKNSARFGWRFVGDNTYEIFAYWYSNGTRDWKLLTTAKANEYLYFSVDVSGGQYYFSVNEFTHTVYGTKNFIPARAFPYFGGDNVAPHKMFFLIAEQY